MIQIDKGIPMPKPTENGRYNRIYPWNELEIGDSFMLPKNYNLGNALALVSTTQKRAGRTAKFKAVMTNNGVRVWRTA